MKYSEKLYQRYKEEISNWDWTKAKKEALKNCFLDHYNDDQVVASLFMGTVFSIYPSGKYYMPWTTNQTAKDVIKDTAYSRALDEVASSHGCWVTSGEGDPCDLFLQFTPEEKDYPELIFIDQGDQEKFEELNP